jgi:tetratricopeptide (TPR) repeat protein
MNARLGAAFSATLGMLGAPPAFALGPFERNQAQVEAGLKAYDDGRYEDALREFDAAKKAMPGSAALEYDRGNALYRIGRFDDARSAYLRAAEMSPGELKEKDLYNLGNALAELGRTQEAINVYRRALALAPNDEAARHNLEVLLRRLPPPQSGGDGGTPDAGQDAGRPDAGQDAGPADGGGADAGRGDGGTGDGGTGGDGGPGDAGTTKGKGPGDAGKDQQKEVQPGEEGNAGADAGVHPLESDAGLPYPEELLDGGTLDMGQLDRRDTERLLDAMRQDEKNLQLWRFQQKKKPRKPNEKDW